MAFTEWCIRHIKSVTAMQHQYHFSISKKFRISFNSNATLELFYQVYTGLILAKTIGAKMADDRPGDAGKYPENF